MDFKKRWFLLMVMVSVIVCLLMFLFQKDSECPVCNLHDCSKSHAETNLLDQNVKRQSNATRIQLSGSHSDASAALRTPGIVMDCITWEVKQNFSLINLVPLRNTLPEHGENDEDRQNTFRKIFHKRDWPADDPSYGGLKASGPGAMMRNAQGAVAALHGLITRLKSHLQKSVISILDLPCGDLQWMSRLLDTRMDIMYTGADIVPEIIKHHRQKFRRFQNAEFIELDIVSMPLNRSFDLIFCRNMLQHLWMADALNALRRISSSGSRFLLATTFHDTEENMDVDRRELGGRKSNYNLEIHPFSLEPPICSSYDWSVEHLSLWPLPLMQKIS